MLTTMGQSGSQGVGGRGRHGPLLAVVVSGGFLALLVATYAVKAAATGFTLDDSVFAISIITAQAVGLLLAVRRPDNLVGWIVCALAWSLAVPGALDAYIELAVQRDWPLTLALWISEKSFLLLWAGVLFLFLYFPTGTLPSPRWRVPAICAAGALVLGLVVLAVTPGPLLEDAPPSASNPMNPTALPVEVWERVEFLSGLTLVLILAALVMAVAALVVRYRASAGVQRLQIRWVVTAGIGFGLVMVVAVTVRHVAPEWLQVADVVAGLAFSLLPLSVGVAVLRFRLYEIDRVINRTVVYTVLTAVLGGAYLALVNGMRAATSQFTGETAVAVAASTLAVAALFQPLRRRIQDAVDRRFNRARYDAAATIRVFSGRLRDEVDLQTLRNELLAVVQSTMQPTTATLWLREVGT